MGCACNRASVTCDDFCDSTAGGAVTPRAWYPKVYLSPSGNYQKYYAIADSSLETLKKTQSSQTAYLHDWVEDATMKSACMTGMRCVCVCVATFYTQYYVSFSPSHHRVCRQRPLQPVCESFCECKPIENVYWYGCSQPDYQ
jgi:hypothetical protein